MGRSPIGSEFYIDESLYGLDQIGAAHDRIASKIHRTPLLQNQWLNQAFDRQFFIKCENLQKGGAFKIRGAVNSVLQLSNQQALRGVVTHSSGNHAQALAIAAKACGIACTVVMPKSSPSVKIQATRDYGATVILCEPNQAARISSTQQVIDQTGATLVHPFDQVNIILGQATVAKEMLEEQPELKILVAPVGGGGLLAGTCLYAKQFSADPEVRILASEPEGADDAYRSLRTQQRITEQVPNTIADGLLTTLGELTWPIIQGLVDDIVTVSDDEIQEAMKIYWERMKLVVEPSGAVPLAAVIKAIHTSLIETDPGDKIGIMISGGNRVFAGV